MALLGRQTFQICKQADRWSWEQEKKWWDCGDTQQLTGTQVSWSCWTVHLLKCACRWSCILMLVKPCYLFLGLFLQWESHTREFRKDFIHLFFCLLVVWRCVAQLTFSVCHFFLSALSTWMLSGQKLLLCAAWRACAEYQSESFRWAFCTARPWRR